jgi:hypothetical protein
MTEVTPPLPFQSVVTDRLRGLSSDPRSSQILFVTASKKIPSLRNAWKYSFSDFSSTHFLSAT